MFYISGENDNSNDYQSKSLYKLILPSVFRLTIWVSVGAHNSGKIIEALVAVVIVVAVVVAVVVSNSSSTNSSSRVFLIIVLTRSID